MDWFYSNALGGVRLLVPENYVDEAKSFLEKDFSDELEQKFGESKECCPECGSLDIEVNNKGKKSAFLAFMFLGLPLFSFRKRNKTFFYRFIMFTNKRTTYMNDF